MQWFIKSVLGDEIPRFIQHLGPRYSGRFQTDDLVKFMTYEASTSLGIFIANVGPSKKGVLSGLMGAIKSGLTIPESSFIFSVTPFGSYERKVKAATLTGLYLDSVIEQNKAVLLENDVFEVNTTSLDLSMWKLGGAAVTLGLIQHAKVGLSLSGTFSLVLSVLSERPRDFSCSQHCNGWTQGQLAKLGRHGTITWV